MGVTVACIGAGSMAREHLRAFAAVPGVTLGGIFSRTRARAEALAKELGAASVHDSIASLAATKADLVVVTVTELSMREIATACFAHPWTVLLEKPAGYDLADAEAIVRAAAARDRVYVALNRRFLSSTRTALEDLETNAGPRFVHVQDQESQEQARQIGHPPAVVDNWMYANSVHVVDYLRVFGRGKVTRVTPVVPWTSEAPVNVASVDFESGDRGLYTGIWRGPGPWAVTVTTPAKRWEMRPLESASYQLAGERKLNPVETHAWDKELKPGFRLQAAEAVAAAEGKPTRLPTLADSLETMRLVHAIFGR